MTDSWGLQAKPKAELPDLPSAPSKTAKRAVRHKLPAKSAQAAHKGIVWLHLSAVIVWIFVALLLGALMVAGKGVPPVVVIACGGAAMGHLAFLGTHLYLARALNTKVAASQPDSV